MEKIVKRAKAGEIRAFEELIHMHELKLYKTASSILICEDDINEAIQQSIILMYNNIHLLKNNKYFSTWFIKILINECRKIYNYNQKNNTVLSTLEDNISVESENTDFSFVNNALKLLDNDFKEVVVLYYYDEFSVSEISKILNIPKGTIKSRLARAREKLKNIILKDDENDE